MQVFYADIVMVSLIMILSWLVGFVVDYVLISTLLNKWKPWEEMNEKEQSSTIGALGLGGFPGIIVWWALGSGMSIYDPVLGLFSIPALIVWVIILMFATALGGVIPLRRSRSDSSQ